MHARKQGNIIYNKEKNQQIESDPEITQVELVDKDIITLFKSIAYVQMKKTLKTLREEKIQKG